MNTVFEYDYYFCDIPDESYIWSIFTLKVTFKWYCSTSQYWESYLLSTWWHHQMETFSTLLAICAGNSPVPGEFPTKRPVTRGFDVFFDLRLNKHLTKQWWCWWFEMLSRPLWHHHNEQKPIAWWCHQIPLRKASDAELWCFRWSVREQMVEQTIET